MSRPRYLALLGAAVPRDALEPRGEFPRDRQGVDLLAGYCPNSNNSCGMGGPVQKKKDMLVFIVFIIRIVDMFFVLYAPLDLRDFAPDFGILPRACVWGDVVSC